MTFRRFDPLDSARASMMLLGIFVHTALILPLFYRNETAADKFGLSVIYQVIHIFRMPTFFFLAGIFASALLVKAGYFGFLTSRFKRIVSVVFTAEVIIALVLLPQGCTACQVIGPTGYLDNGWLHLWFLFYLALISHFFLLVTYIWEKVNQANYRKILSAIAKRMTFAPWQVFLLALFTLVIPNYIGSDGALKMTFALIPNLSLLLVFSLFYVVGWISFFNMDQVLRSMNKYAWFNISIGIAAGLTASYLYVTSNGFWEQLVYSQGMWFITIGLVGLFIRHAPKRNKFFGYFTDASYWIYLWHPIFILLFAYLGVLIGLNIWLSFVITSLLSLFVVSASYTFLVQDTKVDKWLSGRRRRELSKEELLAEKNKR
ncbi:MAG: hypothetical protein EBT26_01340 [Microbacteriaceae bacterium]|nr:hypothetical protein [Microbacteriaceae bacterium]NBS60690.1 hypothetical protein [Microbacteriaceae bacterium]